MGIAGHRSFQKSSELRDCRDQGDSKLQLSVSKQHCDALDTGAPNGSAMDPKPRDRPDRGLLFPLSFHLQTS